MTKNKKMMIETIIEEYMDNKIEGSVVDVIKYLEDWLIVAKKKEYKNMRIEFVWGGENSSHNLVGERPETDKEYEKRLKGERKGRERKKAQREKVKEQEIEQYKKLHEKYGKLVEENKNA